MAPLASDRFGWATMRLTSKNSTDPRPSQRGQAPIGLLNEKSRGSSSGSAYSQPGTGHAYLEEKRCSRPLSLSTPTAAPQAIDHHVDRKLAVFRELRRSIELVHHAVDAHAREALRPQLFEQVRLLAFAPGN